MKTLDAAEVVPLAEHMVETGWSWDASGLDEYLAALGLRRDGELGDIALLPLTSDRIPGTAGMVMGLSSGDVYSVSVSLTEIAPKDDEVGQGELDRVAAEAQAALVQRFGRPRGAKAPVWKLGDRQLQLERLRPAVQLTLVHLPNKAVYDGR